MGKGINPFSQSSTDTYDPNTKIETPICNLSQSESVTNHLSQSCGGTCQFICTTPPPPAPSPTPSGSLAPGPSPSPGAISLANNVTCRLAGVPNVCDYEKAYLRGQFIQMVLDQKNAVIAEMRATRALNVSSRCNAPAGTFTNIVTSFNSAQGQWNAYWSRAGAGQVPYCGDGARSPGIASCPLESARKSLENFPFQTAVCEILARAEIKWLADMPLSPLHQVIRDTLAAQMGSGPGQCDPNQNACLNAAYSRAIKGQIASSTVAQAPASFTLTPNPVLNCASSGGPPGWESILCSAYPPAPFAANEVGSAVKAGNALGTTPGMIDAALKLLSNAAKTAE